MPIIINLLIELTFETLCLMELSSFEEMLASSKRAENCDSSVQSFDNISRCYSYITLDPIVNLEKLRVLFQGLCLMFMPFNVFWLVTYMRGTDLIIKLSNMVAKFLKFILADFQDDLFLGAGVIFDRCDVYMLGGWVLCSFSQ